MSYQKTEIEITIDKEGNISYEVKGIKGKSCIEATKFLDESLGEVVERKHSREFYEHPVRRGTQIRRGRP